MIEIVTATRKSEAGFRKETALGISLRRLSYDKRLVARVAFENRRGLPEIFNAGIAAAGDDDILVFMHDDVWIDDIYFGDRIVEGLKAFDVIGVAGNRRRVPKQPSWAFVSNIANNLDHPNLSGSVAHGKHPFGALEYFGPVPGECELLDGMFLAARKSVLAASEVAFDPRFDFHFYDMDICRSAKLRGLRLGTWPICLTHQSSGAFGGASWFAMYTAYLAKWKD
jgi:GT2 family glycosyltransferase